MSAENLVAMLAVFTSLRERLTGPGGVLLFLVAVKLSLHGLTWSRYGYFRDELYYMACGWRLDWGYVDHPPFVPLAVRLSCETLGESLLALRLLSVTATAAVVWLTGRMAQRLGGGRFAVALAALAAVASPAGLVMGSFLSVNSFDILWWTLALYLFTGILRHESPYAWVALGCVVAIGLLTKYTMLFLAFGMAAGLVLTRSRRKFQTPWPWLAAAAAFVLVSGNLVWQVRKGWPTLEFLHNIHAFKNYPLSPIEFAAMQVVAVHPLLLTVWLAGLLHYWRADAGRFRPLAWVYITVLALLLLLRGKFYYAFPLYPTLFAAGGVALERRLQADRFPWCRGGLVITIVLGCGFTLPYALPILPMDTFLACDRWLGIQRHLRLERGRVRSRPIVYADMVGWPELAEAVAEVYHSRHVEAQSTCVVLTANYGEAGAVDLFGKQLGLPAAVSPHNSYHLWGPGQVPWNTVITVGFDDTRLTEFFEEISLARTIQNQYARESRVQIHVCRGLKMPMGQVWARLKRYR